MRFWKKNRKQATPPAPASAPGRSAGQGVTDSSAVLYTAVHDSSPSTSSGCDSSSSSGFDSGGSSSSGCDAGSF